MALNQTSSNDMPKLPPSDMGSVAQALSALMPSNMATAFAEDLFEAVQELQSSWSADMGRVQSLVRDWRDALETIGSNAEAELPLPERFDKLSQTNHQFLCKLIDEAPDLETRFKNRLHFWQRHHSAVLDFNHWPLTNPEVWKKAAESEGGSLARGLLNMQADAAEDLSRFHVKRCDSNAFELGADLAKTPGHIVFQNELIQLIHYKSKGENLSTAPILIVPPCINKYYILDLTEELSLANWLVSQEADLYMISWRNPDSAEHQFSLADYLECGVESARDFVLNHSGAAKLHLAGYCIGGLLAALVAGTPKSKESLASLTLMATLIDYREPGELDVFLSKRTTAALLENVEEQGFMHGNMLSWAFTLLREKQLLWPYLIKRYWLGEDLPQDPVMFWNQDVSNLSATMVAEYLTSFYLKNRYWADSEIQINERSFSLSNISMPTYLLACKTDHIVNWKRSLHAAEKIPGSCRRVLVSGGHVMGVLSSPYREKPGRYWVVNDASDVGEWEPAFAEGHVGSWWLDWLKWLRANEEDVPISGGYSSERATIIEPAPGSYVAARS